MEAKCLHSSCEARSSFCRVSTSCLKKSLSFSMFLICESSLAVRLFGVVRLEGAVVLFPFFNESSSVTSSRSKLKIIFNLPGISSSDYKKMYIRTKNVSEIYFIFYYVGGSDKSAIRSINSLKYIQIYIE